MARKLPADLFAMSSSIDLSQEDALRLERAAFHEFREPVTAYLTSVYFDAGFCQGIVWCHDRADAAGRFADGHKIHTSQVVTFERDGEFQVIVTLNSRYVMISLQATLVPPSATVH